MQAPNNMKLRYGFTVPGRGSFVGLFQRHGVSAGSVFLATKSAKAAGCNADVGRINVPVDVEIRSVAVQAFANMVRQPANRKDIACTVKDKSIVPGEALSLQNLACNRLKADILRLKFMLSSHIPMITHGRRIGPENLINR